MIRLENHDVGKSSSDGICAWLVLSQVRLLRCGSFGGSDANNGYQVPFRFTGTFDKLTVETEPIKATLEPVLEFKWSTRDQAASAVPEVAGQPIRKVE